MRSPHVDAAARFRAVAGSPPTPQQDRPRMPNSPSSPQQQLRLHAHRVARRAGLILLVAAALIVPRVMERPTRSASAPRAAEIRTLRKPRTATRRTPAATGDRRRPQKPLAHQTGRGCRVDEPARPICRRCRSDPEPLLLPVCQPQPKHGPTTSTRSGGDGHPGGEGIDADIGNWNLDDRPR